MKEAALKSFNHLYRILKVYLTMAVCGALVVVGIQLLLAKTLLVVSVLAGIVIVALLLFVFVSGTSEESLSQERRRELFKPREATSFHYRQGTIFQERGNKAKKDWRKKK